MRARTREPISVEFFTQMDFTQIDLGKNLRFVYCFTFYEFVLCHFLHFTKICYNEVEVHDMDFKRKAYHKLEEWKKEPNRRPLIIDGLRQIGKSYIVDKFARANYENVIVYDFRHRKNLRKIFAGNLNVDEIIRLSGPYFPSESFIPHKTVLIFEEIGDCPLARTSLKSFALDKRFDVIATGSLLGVLNYRKKSKIDIPDGYETIIRMTSMDFEEFLWANGVKEEAINTLKHHVKTGEELPLALEQFYREMIKRYVVVGGMPAAVEQFLLTNNYVKSRDILVSLLEEYRGDFGRFINDDEEEEFDYRLQASLNKVFSSLPSQLARETETKKFKFSEIEKGGRASKFEDSFVWLEKMGLVNRCFNLKAIESPLTANADNTYFKAFFSDIGLLMASFPISVSQQFLREELGSRRKGAIYENLAATMIVKAGFPLHYFSNGQNHLDIDFIIETDEGIELLEEKSTNGKMAASKSVMEGKTPYRAVACHKIIQTNFGKGEFYHSIPQYALPFLLEMKAEKLEAGISLPKLGYPGSETVFEK